MELEQLSQLASVLRSSVPNKSNVFTISTNLLSIVIRTIENTDMETMSSSFYTRQSSNASNNILPDVYFLQNFIQQAKTVKLYLDNTLDESILDISLFKTILSLELNKVDVKRIKGLQKLRSQLHKLICYRTLNNLHDVLNSCGADQSQGYYWNELKELGFINNELYDIDNSLECTPWLHTLDLSHNHLTNVEVLNVLVNLKHLNLSYNKLDSVPKFKGQICTRLQNLILKNNFIEDINGLQTLLNLCVLDLSNNCILDHKELTSISHIATLQWLNLSQNPLSFHPLHRTKASSYLHINTSTTNFVLDKIALKKDEKRLIGTLYPTQVKNLPSFATDSISVSSEKPRKVRHVTIEDDTVSKPTETPLVTPTSQQHLQTKKQIESLRKQYGDSWLKLDSGVVVQNVLGLEQTSLPMSSSPYEADFLIHSADYRPESLDITTSTINKSDTTFVTALETTSDITKEEDSNFEENKEDDETKSESGISEGDLDLDGEECIYLVTPQGETEQIFLIITRTHITEKECSTSEERARWHINSVTNCEAIEDDSHTIKIEFDTMRKDRKQRVYEFDEDEDKFIALIKSKLEARLPEKTDVDYQCMKCSKHFSMANKGSVLEKPVVKCPTCDSTLVVETL